AFIMVRVGSCWSAARFPARTAAWARQRVAGCLALGATPRSVGVARSPAQSRTDPPLHAAPVHCGERYVTVRIGALSGSLERGTSRQRMLQTDGVMRGAAMCAQRALARAWGRVRGCLPHGGRRHCAHLGAGTCPAKACL